MGQKSHVDEFKLLTGFKVEMVRNQRGIKKAGFTHYVVENTCRNNVGFRLYHYIHENKQFILL
jgi:hypothetical protein